MSLVGFKMLWSPFETKSLILFGPVVWILGSNEVCNQIQIKLNSGSSNLGDKLLVDSCDHNEHTAKIFNWFRWMVLEVKPN